MWNMKYEIRNVKYEMWNKKKKEKFNSIGLK